MQNFYAPFDWQTGTMISPNETNLIVGADRIGESIRPGVQAFPFMSELPSYKASKPTQT